MEEQSNTQLTAPEISIAMPFCNSSKTLDLTIRSILSQTYRNFELLLCDDGSTDRSIDIVRSFNDTRIVCWSDGKRKRLPSRLNECIDKARGRYLARMDSDDVAYPQRLGLQLNFLEEHPSVDLCATSALVIGADGNPLWKFNPETDHAGITRVPYRGFPMIHPTWMGRIEWFRKWRYSEAAHLGQDQEILLRALRESTYANLPQTLLGFRQESVRLKRLFFLKLDWIRQVCQSRARPTNLMELTNLVSVQAIRFGANCAAKLLGPAASRTRQYALPVSQSEKQFWEEVCLSLTPEANKSNDQSHPIRQPA